MSVSVMAAEAYSAKNGGSCTPVPAPAPHPRRPRVREVSSRFMSPVVSISSSTLSGDLHMISDRDRSPMHKLSLRSCSVQRRRDRPEAVDVLELRDEKENENENRLDLGLREGFKKPQRAAVKLFKENNEMRVENKSLDCGGIEVGSRFMAPKRRPDTPNVSSSFDKNRLNRSIGGGAGSATPAAARQLKLGGMPSAAATQSSPKVVFTDDSDSSSSLLISSRDSVASDTSSLESSSCSTSPTLIQKCRTPRQLPESNTLITVSSRYLGDRTGSRGISGNSVKMSASPCCRSLNMSVSSSIQQGLSNGNNLPPHPPASKIATDAKVRKINTQQEIVHSLRLLHNRYLQWRYSNAKAEAASRAQKQEAEIMLYSLSIKIMDLRQSAMSKRIELGYLRRSKILLSILDAQMPNLESWNTFEDEFVKYLSEIINALLHASVQLPVSGNIKVDLKEFRVALSSALKVLEMIECQISSFFPKAMEMDKILSELARVNAVERNYIKESGYLLSKTHMLQADECSSVAQLIQLQQRKLG